MPQFKEAPVNNPKMFDKYEICGTYKDLIRINTSKSPSFNSWVVPCTTDAVCIKHGENKFESFIINERILLSAYTYYEDFIDLIDIFADDINTHLIVPCYYEEHVKSGNRLDAGISINGKCKKGEQFIDTMKREIAEEVGILVTKPAKKVNVSVNAVDKNYGIFYARDCKPYSPLDKIKFSDKEDLPRKKIYSCILGSLEECKDLVLRSRELYPSNEFNYGVAIIPVTTVFNYNYLNKIIK